MNEEENIYDLIVVGGGAAGFFTAISFAELATEKPKIVILEKGSEVLQKVKISGGGRCNVTHDCHDPREFVTRYPRGQRTLPGPLHRWNAADMIDWLAVKGIKLKVEPDGRMFPVTDDSQTVIDCFLDQADEHGIEIQCRSEVEKISVGNKGAFLIEMKDGEVLRAKNVLISTGGIRTPSGAHFARDFGHTVQEAAPSLFTFKISDPRIEGLSGISVPEGKATIVGTKFAESGPILITHWGLSGPGILKLSARAARELQDCDYQFEVEINWTGQSAETVTEILTEAKTETGRQTVKANPKYGIPSRLWRSLCEAADIDSELKWGNFAKKELQRLVAELTACRFRVNGKSMNKDEFVTCGGVTLKEVNFKTMESKLQPGLYFAGEVLDIDGITGGFNFQAAWTTARIAGGAIAENI